MYIHRSIENFITTTSEHFPVLLITGPRQVGKTTLLKHLAGKERTYVTLDDPLVLAAAQEDPELFLQRFSPPVLIDEIQYAPTLLPHIKMYVDQHQEKGAFWLTGSQQFHLMQGISESLAGRVALVNLLGLSLGEQLQISQKTTGNTPFVPTQEYLAQREPTAPSLNLTTTYQHIWRGSFPALVSDPSIDHDIFMGSYVQTYLQRDIRALGHIGETEPFVKFLRSVAARTGQLLNIDHIARESNISPSAAQKWLHILITSGLVFLLEPYHNNLSNRLVKAPKLYFLDTGLCAYLTAWSSPETLERGALSGAIFETFCISEILKSYYYAGKRPPLYYYRDKDKKEIDLLIAQDDTLYPVEIKKTSHPTLDDIRHFHVLEKFGKMIGEGGVLCLANTWVPLDKNTSAIPIGML